MGNKLHTYIHNVINNYANRGGEAMPEWGIHAVSGVAVALILYGLFLTLRYRPAMPGGIVGRNWRVLMLLVFLFTIGYVALPFFGLLTVEALRLVVTLVFLFGALYVVITVRLIHQIVRELSE